MLINPPLSSIRHLSPLRLPSGFSCLVCGIRCFDVVEGVEFSISVQVGEFSNLDFVAGEELSATLGVEVLEGAHLFFFKEFCLECCILL